MGDRANIYLEMLDKEEQPDGIYLYTHYYGYEWPERLREALEFGRGRWHDDQYLARIIISRVFADLVNNETGGGVSLRLCDNEHPIIVCDLINQWVSFADPDSEREQTGRGGMSFTDYIKQDRADYPPESSDD